MTPMHRHSIAFTTMLAGSAGVFGVVYWMNAAEPAPELQSTGEVVAFEVERKPPPKRERPKREEPAPKRSVTSTPRAPLPNLNAALRGASFDLPRFEAAPLDQVSESLLGDTRKKMVCSGVGSPRFLKNSLADTTSSFS